LTFFGRGIAIGGSLAVLGVNAERGEWPNPSWDHAEEMFDVMVKDGADPLLEALALADTPEKQRLVRMCLFVPYSYFVAWNRPSTLAARIELEELWGGEAKLVEAMEEYDFHGDGPVQKTVAKVDIFRFGVYMMPVLLRYGNLTSYKSWLRKNLAVYQEVGVAETKDFSIDWCEIAHPVWKTSVPLMIQCGLEADCAALQDATGMSQWDEAEGFLALWAPFSTSITFTAHLKDKFLMGHRFLVYLASPEDQPRVTREQVASFMPSPQALIETDRVPDFHLWHHISFVSLGSRCFLRLGDKDEEAAETARGGLAEAKKCTTRVECHRVLGIVATRRGDHAAAEAAFLAGAEDAHGCGLYLLELLCARDLVQFVYEGQGRVAEGEAMIEAAATRMGKERADFEELLNARREW